MISLSGQTPSPGERHVDPATSIEFTIEDDGNGIDISTLIVELNGSRAIEGIEFQNGFEGLESEITPDGDNYLVVIDPEEDFELGTVSSLKIQVRDLNGDYLNSTYSFKIIPEEPVLVTMSPDQGKVLTSSQFIYFEFEDTIDGVEEDSVNITINGLSYISDGEIDEDLNSSYSSITETDDGLIVRIDPIEPLKTGDYSVWYSVSDSAENELHGELKFSVLEGPITLPTDFPQTGFLGFYQGIKKAADQGVGDTIKIEWNTPIKRHNIRSEVFILVYENEKRLDIFDGDPTYITSTAVSSGTITGLATGTTLSYAARAMETFKDSFSPVGMEVVSNGFYRVPPRSTITESVSDTSLKIKVNSVEGYPSRGYLLIGREVIRYTSISESEKAFNVPSTNGRGLNNSTPGIYIEGDEVRIFFNCQDSNTVIVMATPTYSDGYHSGREINSEGILVTDYSDNDNIFFQGYDFCGYHKALPQQTLQGVNDCPSYLGGEYNGFRGMDLYDRMIGQEEVLLDQVGEPIVLLKRIWSGEKCDCTNLREDHPKLKSCPDCYGTTWEGGYRQYQNPRRDDKRIMVSFKESPEDLSLTEHGHLSQEFEPPAWTLPIPAIRDRDVLVRFDLTDDVEYIYEVLNASREKILFRKFGRQNLTLKRMDKTDILYTLIKSSIIDNTFLPTIK